MPTPTISGTFIHTSTFRNYERSPSRTLAIIAFASALPLGGPLYRLVRLAGGFGDSLGCDCDAPAGAVGSGLLSDLE